MDEKSLKTSFKQRLVIIIVAVLMVASTMLAYVLVVLSGNGRSATVSNNSDAKIEQLTAAYDEKQAALTEAAKPFSDKYFPVLKPYLSEVKAYNEQNATNSVLATKDLKVGTGRELKEDDKDYFAYYVGWCADGSIFDSSLNNKGKEDTTDPTGLNVPIDPSGGLIEGWEQGIVGAKLGGVRMITMNGDLAYGETQEICGGTNKPLRFLVLPIERDAKLDQLNDELMEAYQQLYMAYYDANTQ